MKMKEVLDKLLDSSSGQEGVSVILHVRGSQLPGAIRRSDGGGYEMLSFVSDGRTEPRPAVVHVDPEAIDAILVLQEPPRVASPTGGLVIPGLK